MLYIFDKDDKFIDAIGEHSSVAIFDKTKELNDIQLTLSNRKSICKYNKIGLYVGKEFRLYEIDTVKKIIDAATETLDVIAINDIINLNRNLIEDKRMNNADINQALTKALENTQYSPGIVEAFENRTLNYYDISSLNALNLLLSTYDAEFKSRIILNPNNTLSKYIDIVHQLGEEKNTRYTFDTALNDVIREESQDAHFNILYGRGKALETENGGYSRKLNFASVNNGKTYIEDVESIKKYGRLSGIYEQRDIEDPGALLQATREKLNEVKELSYNYITTLKDIRNRQGFEHYNASIGDTIIIRDEERDAIFKSRIVAMNYYIDEDGNIFDIVFTMGKMFKGLFEYEDNSEINIIKDRLDIVENTVPSIEEIYPDTLPQIPVLKGKGLYASIMLEWSFENKEYYTYELYGSKLLNFNPGKDNLIFEGKSSSGLFQAEARETWYFKVRAVNSYGKATLFSQEIRVDTAKISDATQIFEDLAIGHALIKDLDMDKATVGKLKGQFIEAKNLKVVDGNGTETLSIDDWGNVELNVKRMSIMSKDIDRYFSKKTSDYIARYVLNSPCVVIDNTLPIYAKSEIPKPPIGAVFGSYRRGTGTIKKDSVSSNGVAWAIITAHDICKNTKDNYTYRKAENVIRIVANYILSCEIPGDMYGKPIKVYDVGKKYDSVTGTWKTSNYKEIYFTAVWLQLKAFVLAYEILREKKYIDAAINILNSLAVFKTYIDEKVNGGEMPLYMRGASFEFMVCSDYSVRQRFTPSRSHFPLQMGYYIVQAIRSFQEVIGDIELTTEHGFKYRPGLFMDEFREYLNTAYESGGLTTSATGLPYGYYHRESDAQGQDVYVLRNWNFIDDIWGDTWFVGDVVTYVIYGFASLGLHNIAREYLQKYLNLSVPYDAANLDREFSKLELCFYDRMNFDGTPLIDDNSISITYTALVYDILNELGINENVDRCIYTLTKHQVNNVNDLYSDGGYPWDINRSLDDVGASLEFKSFGEIIQSKVNLNMNIGTLNDIENTIVDMKIDADGIKNEVTKNKNALVTLDGEVKKRLLTTAFTEFQQSYNDFKYLIGERASVFNVVRNGNLKGGLSQWWGHSKADFYFDVLENYEGYGFKKRNVLRFKTTRHYQYESSVYSSSCYDCEPHTEYTLNFHYACEKNVERMRGYLMLSNTQGGDYGKIIPLLSVGGGSQSDTHGDVPYSIRFNTEGYKYFWLRFDNDGIKSGENVENYHWCFISDVACYKGNVGAIPFIPHMNELYSNTITMNVDMIQAMFEDGTYSQMGRQGFKWYSGSTGYTHHAMTHVASITIPSGNPGRIRIELPYEFYQRRESLRYSGAFRGYYFNTSGNFFPYYVQVSTNGHEVDHVNKRIYVNLEGYARIQNGANSNDTQNMPKGVNAYLIAIC